MTFGPRKLFPRAKASRTICEKVSEFASRQGNGWLLNNIAIRETQIKAWVKTVASTSLTIMNKEREERKEGRKEKERKEGRREREREREKREEKERSWQGCGEIRTPMHGWLLDGLQCRPWKSWREAVPLPRGLHRTSATSRGQALSPSSHNGKAILQW